MAATRWRSRTRKTDSINIPSGWIVTGNIPSGWRVTGLVELELEVESPALVQLLVQLSSGELD